VAAIRDHGSQHARIAVDALLTFAEDIIRGVLDLAILLVVVYAVLSWLVAFNVVNMRNQFVYQVTRSIEGIANWLLWPIRRVLPTLGGFDFSPIIFWLVVGAINNDLIPPLFSWLHRVFGAQ
jgi:YggT family protein